MRVLGRELVPPLGDFWEKFGREIGVPPRLIEEGRGEVFGSEGYRGDPVDLSGSELPRWMDLPGGPLSFHVAHELTHLLLRRRGFPTTLRGRQHGEGSPEARVCGDLDEMISHPALETLLRPFPFDKTHIQDHLFEGARRGLESSPRPEPASPWWATWAIRFCELQFLLPRQSFSRLEVVYDGRCPDIARKGRELVEIMHGEGYLTPDQALGAMVAARDALGLREVDRCLVLDPRDGTFH